MPPFGGSIVDKQHDRYNKENKKKKEKEALSVKLKTEMAGLKSCC